MLGQKQFTLVSILLAVSVGSVRSEPSSRAIRADLDSDGAPDLVRSLDDGSSRLELRFAVRASSSTHRWRPGPAVELPTPVRPDFVAAGDVDGDAAMDLVVAERNSDAVWVIPGRRGGGFGGPRHIELEGAITALAVADVNRADGIDDIIVALTGPLGSSLAVLQGERSVLPLPGPASRMVAAPLDDQDGTEIAALCNDEMVVVRGRDRRLTVRQPGDPEDAPVVDRIDLGESATDLAVADD